MGDNHVVAGAIPAIETDLPPPLDGTRFCEDRWRRFNSFRWHRAICFTSPSGTGLVSKTGQQCSIHWWRALPDRRLGDVGPPCGVTAAGSSLAI